MAAPICLVCRMPLLRPSLHGPRTSLRPTTRHLSSLGQPRPLRAVSLLLALERGSAGPVRALSVAQRYQPICKDPALFDPALVKEWLDPQFAELCLALDAGADVQSLVAQLGEMNDVYSFPLLNNEACDRLCDEIEHFGKSGLPARRPNSMNRYGLILNEIGMRPSLDALQAAVAGISCLV